MIGIASDHRGIELKSEMIKYIKNLNYEVIDYGTNTPDSVDYPTYAFKIGEDVRDNKIKYGILICGTGIGMSIAANKVNKVRCAKVSSIEESRLAREHNNANVIAISSNVENVYEIIKIFLETDFSKEEKHHHRVDLIDKYDN